MAGENERTVSGLRVWSETRRKARLLAAQRDTSLAQAIDDAVTAALGREGVHLVTPRSTSVSRK